MRWIQASSTRWLDPLVSARGGVQRDIKRCCYLLPGGRVIDSPIVSAPEEACWRRRARFRNLLAEVVASSDDPINQQDTRWHSSQLDTRAAERMFGTTSRTR